MTIVAPSDLEDALRARLLTFASPLDGRTLASSHADRLFIDDPREGAVRPFAVLRLVPVSALDARQEFRAELQFWRAPSSSRAETLALRADMRVACEAMAAWSDVGALSAAWSARNPLPQTIPRATDPADAEMAGGVVTWTVTAYLRYLLQYGQS